MMKKVTTFTALIFFATLVWMSKYLPKQIEVKWQKRWLKDKLYSPDLDKASRPFYNLWMFPYPSGEGLHIGHFYASCGSDIYGRYQRMKGMDVFQPIGYDAFGIHSENYALKVGTHPKKLITDTTNRYADQLYQTGHGYDWTRVINTSNSNYYKWTQWLFLQMYKNNLAYKKEAEVNWCPSCLTVLADEQVISGECERCQTEVVKKKLEQWFFRITSFADRLLSNLEKIDWTEKVKLMQKNWIGKSEGTVINFGELKVFTTRPDTIFGTCFLVISPMHPLLTKLTKPENKAAVEDYLAQLEKERHLKNGVSRHKNGIFTGSYVKNPLSEEMVPVWVAGYVVMDYGTGAVMGVPAHDQRDFEFAKANKLSVKQVIRGKGKAAPGAYDGEGVLIASGPYTNLSSEEARIKITNYIERNHLGQKKFQYHLRDWLISRQRYWGPPIPVVYCHQCGVVPVEEKDLPVMLPEVENFRPTGTGKSPLALVPEFVNTVCPKCSGPAERETDVSDTFLDSAWYFLRYPSTEFDNKPFDPNRTKKWLPVNMYLGGAEHSVLHLLYARFVTMVLKDLGYIDFEEPFSKFRAHGMIIKDGAKMSKSKGNVVVPDEYVKTYGADTLRTYLMFMGPLEDGGDFRDAGIFGIYRFLERVWRLAEKLADGEIPTTSLKIMHKTIEKVSRDIESLKYNTALSAMMEWLNHLSKSKTISKTEYQTYLLLLAPFAPHLTEELWQFIGGKYSIHQQKWPVADNKYLEDSQVEVVIQINGKLRETIMIDKDIVNNKEVIEKKALDSIKISLHLEGKSVKKSVYIPGRLLNLVV